MASLQSTNDFLVEYLQKPLDSFALYIWSLIVGQNSTVYYWTHEYWQQGIDFRTRGYFLVDVSGVGIASNLFLYIMAVLFVIPKFMENRKPFELRMIMIVYDFLMVAINAYFWCYSVYHIRDMFDFSNPKYDTSEKAMKFINTAHLYYISKWVDLFDTLFMALKKKNSHITFLHVWHHVSVPSGGYLMMKYNAYMPTEYLFPLLNGFVHVVMYGYYGLAALGPHMQKYLWWKRYITQLQLFQFTLALVWISYVLYKATDLPFGFNALNLLNDLALFILFINFYIKSYLSDKKQHVKSE